jgi:acetyltransferase
MLPADSASTPAFPDLRRLFAPRRVAYIGATEDIRKFGGRCIRELLDFGFQGELYPINPRRSEVFGVPCYPSIEALPQVPDHVGIVLPAEAIPDALASCGRMGVPFATVFSAGFAETATETGRALQERIVEVARAHGIRFVGPNCNGLVNFVDRVAMTSTASIRGPRRAAGDIGVVSNSGGAGQVNVMWRAQELGLGISYQISCGNDADLDLIDYMAFMVEDPGTRVVLAIAERLASGERLAALAARAAQLGKPIVMVKVGRSEAGSRMAASHTGAVTGADEVVSAALDELGIIRVDDCNELYEAAMVLRSPRRPRGRAMTATSLSGGNLVMIADLGGARGMTFPSFAPSTTKALAELLPGFVAAGNPTDLTAAAVGRDDVFSSVCRVLHDDPAIDIVMPVITFAPASDIRSLMALDRSADKPFAILWTGRCSDDLELTPARLIEQGHIVFRDVLPAIKALDASVRWQDARVRRAANRLNRPEGMASPQVLRTALAGTGALDEHRSKQIVAAYGLRLAAEQLVETADQAVAVARAIGSPIALKLASADITHKTEAGVIRLGLVGEPAIRAAWAEVMAAAQRYRPGARISGMLVQEMVTEGEELLLGLSRDPVFGPVITVGLGGIFVEVLRDVARALAPVSGERALELLKSLRSFALLDGARGRPRLDVAAAADAMVRLSWLAVDAGEALTELDINPLRVLPQGQGVRVIDALVVRSGPVQQ